MSQEDVDVLRHAKDTLENPRLGTKITHLIGLPLERVMRQLLARCDLARYGKVPGDRAGCSLGNRGDEVFALDGSSAPDDGSEVGYFAIRAALSAAVADAARHFAVRGGATQSAPAIVRLIAQIANRFGATVTQKAAAQAVPVVGAAGGAAVNILFINHFQDIGWGHFTVRRLERKYGPEVVKRTYQEL
jgi:hypothetical protein